MEGTFSRFFFLKSILLKNIIGLGDQNLKGDFELDIPRAKISSTKCLFPQCNRDTDLHRIPHMVRYSIMKNKKFFIPQKGIACRRHCEYSSWSAVNIPRAKYLWTSALVTEMTDLLCTDFNQRDINNSFAGRLHSIAKSYTVVTENAHFCFSIG